LIDFVADGATYFVASATTLLWAFMSFSSLAIIGAQMLFALLLDKLLGEPTRFHPLVYFGSLANRVATKYHPPAPFEAALPGNEASLGNEASPGKQPSQVNSTKAHNKARLKGTLCWLVLVLPLPIVLWVLNYFVMQYAQSAPSLSLTALACLVNGYLLYLTIGMQSLKEHAMQIYQPLAQGNITKARHFTGYIVSRDTNALTPNDMSRATVESVLENGHDGVIASLFYFAVGGAPLAVLHRLANTLDAMWGYKTPRFLHFGWWSARADDHLGWISTYCTSILYVLAASPPFRCKHLSRAWQQAKGYKSKNGGRCMATGAGVLHFTLGGISQYQGKTVHSPVLGHGKAVALADIPRSIALVNSSAWLLASALLLLGIIMQSLI
jgi:adenosylcobinamide-phosphate synthase